MARSSTRSATGGRADRDRGYGPWASESCATGSLFTGILRTFNRARTIGQADTHRPHAIENSGNFPSDSDLRQIGHDLRTLLPRCELIGKTVDPGRPYASRPIDSIHQGIEETLSEFAAKSRYYNINYINGGAGKQTDPIAMWWDKVASPICERHYSDRQRKKDAARASVMTELLGAPRNSTSSHGKWNREQCC